MSIIAPSTTVTLYHDVPITDEKNLIFKSIANQRSYFAGKVYRTSVECSYERAGAPLMLDIPISDMYKFNYLSFKNEAFENKEIYARTLPPVYINNEVLAVPYVIDYWQTFMFDITMDKCGILRQHPTVGEENEMAQKPHGLHYSYMTPEPLSFSDNYRKNRNNLNSTFISIMAGEPYMLGQGHTITQYSPVACVATSQQLSEVDSETVVTQKPVYSYETNFLSAVQFMYFSCDADGLYAMQSYINQFVSHQMVSSILGVWYVPSLMTVASKDMKVCVGVTSGTGEFIYDNVPVTWKNLREKTITLQLGESDEKLNHYPFRYIRVTDFLGNRKEYKIDRFNEGDLHNNEITFGLFYTMNGYPQVILAPKNYRGSYVNPDSTFNDKYDEFNFEEKMIITDFPQIGYNTDGYLAWVGGVYQQQASFDTTAAPWTYNDKWAKISAGSKIIGGIISDVASVMGNEAPTGNSFKQWAEARGNMWDYHLNKTMHDYSQKFYNEPTSNQVAIPDFMADAIPLYAADNYHIGGSTCGLPACMFDRVGFLVEELSLLPEVSTIYTDFFSKYGYAQNKIDTPAVYEYTRQSSGGQHDPTFNSESLTFVKTESCSVEGANIEVTRAIENMFNGGHWFAAPDNT